MLGKDYVKNEIISRLNVQTPEEIENDLGIDVLIVTSIEFVEDYGEPFGDVLTAYDIERLYVGGLTFSEIGYLRGNTKEGIRRAFDKIAGNDKLRIKQEHKKVREKIKERIMYDRLQKEIQEKGKEGAREALGYSKTYFSVLCKQLEKVGGELHERHTT